MDHKQTFPPGAIVDAARHSPSWATAALQASRSPFISSVAKCPLCNAKRYGFEQVRRRHSRNEPGKANCFVAAKLRYSADSSRLVTTQLVTAGAPAGRALRAGRARCARSAGGRALRARFRTAPSAPLGPKGPWGPLGLVRSLAGRVRAANMCLLWRQGAQGGVRYG